MMRPGILEPTFLVYRECPCGGWVCTGEGARAPICPECGGRYVPGGTTLLDDGTPMYGRGDDPFEQRGIRSLGFVGFLTNESGAVGLVQRVKGFLGLYGSTGHLNLASHMLAGFDRGPYFSESERRRASERIEETARAVE